MENTSELKVHNFSAGPSILPRQTFEACAQAVLDLNGSGLSILEISHRSQVFTEIIETARQKLRRLLNIPEHYEVLFLQGGASMQFCMVPCNLHTKNSTAYYLETGTWAKKAIKESKIFGQTEVIASSKDQNFNYIPGQYTIPDNGSYLHITTNNTIYGTQIQHIPEVSIPLVADMSSDILSKPIDVEQFDLIYAGAQKNIGPSGVTVVIINPDILGKVDRKIPSMLDYRIHISKSSMFNTPNTFGIYGILKTLEWLEDNGGIEQAQRRNQTKAHLLYHELDQNPLFQPRVKGKDRSEMNVTFDLTDRSMANTFDKLCHKHHISGIKGHRSVGGYRASIYNAMPFESVQVLVQAMQTLKKQV